MIWDLNISSTKNLKLFDVKLRVRGTNASTKKGNVMGNSKLVLNILNGALSILLVILLVFVILKAGDVAYDLGYRVFTEPAMEKAPGRDIAVQVTKGMSAMELGTMLERKKLVDNGLLFAIQLQVSECGDKLAPGIYTLNTSQTAKEMIQILAGEEFEEKVE